MRNQEFSSFPARLMSLYRRSHLLSGDSLTQVSLYIPAIVPVTVPPLPTQSTGVNIPSSYQPEIPCDLLSLFLNFSHSLVSSPFIKS